MARYEHLPIFKNAYDLALDLDKRVHGFSRFHKYSIGEDLRAVIREALKLIIKANNVGDKRPVLLDLRWQLEYLKVLLRLAYDSGAFPTGKKGYLFTAEKAVELARQNEGWLKAVSSRSAEDKNQ
jgi:hypothetical protein